LMPGRVCDRLVVECRNRVGEEALDCGIRQAVW